MFHREGEGRNAPEIGLPAMGRRGVTPEREPTHRPALSAGRAAASVALLAAAAFLTLALVSFDPHDPPDPDVPVNAVVTNACGQVGAWLAKTLLLYLGGGAYLLALLACFWTYVLAAGRPAARTRQTLLAVGAAILSTSTLVAVLAETAPFRWLETTRIPSPGGLVGTYAASMLLGLVALPGTLLLLGTTVLIAVILATDLLLVRAAAALGRTVSAWLVWVRARWAERRKALVLTRALVAAKERRRTPVVRSGEPSPEVPVVSRAAAELGMALEVTAPGPAAVRAEPEEAGAWAGLGSVSAPEPSAGEPEETSPLTYELPTIDFLDDPEEVDMSIHEEVIQQKAQVLERCLAEFDVSVEVVGIRTGPVITQYELSLAPGTKVGKVLALRDNIAMALKSTSVRIIAPIPGRGTVGVEVPNAEKNLVRLKELFHAVDTSKMQIPLFLGKDVSGHPVVSDLTQMPHLLIAGCTGSGKSVCINSIIVSMLMTRTPRELKLLLVDPKMVELTVFRDLPHLFAPVVTDMKKAASILAWAERTMDERYELLSAASAKNIVGFNALAEADVRRRLRIDDPEVRAEDIPHPLPYIVVIIDELADLMMLNRTGEVESSITRLAQKSRAVGIHIIFATQRPSVDVITGLIKANLPARIAFQVTSYVDSRTILDQNGAEKLLGRGDMLYLPPHTAKLLRAQGTFVSEQELHRIVGYVCERARPRFSRELIRLPGSRSESPTLSNSERDELYDDAVRILVASGRGSVSLLQRRLEIGYTRAARLVDMMAEDGIVGEYKEGKARDVLVSEEELNSRPQARQSIER